jgi:hypothetical protein
MTTFSYINVGKSRTQDTTFFKSLLHHIVVLIQIQNYLLGQANDLSHHFVGTTINEAFYFNFAG